MQEEQENDPNKFYRYPSLSKWGNTDVEDIDIGECYVFPKLDGTNGSVWFDGETVRTGSRNRELSLDNDNAGFHRHAVEENSDVFLKFFKDNPTLRLFGEWLVPHSLKTYDDSAWRTFYVFDVMNMETGEFVHYDLYYSMLDSYGIEYIPCMFKTLNPTYEHLTEYTLKQNVFKIKDGQGFGEGIVIKRYGYKNRFGRTHWAKIITNEFKDKHIKEMGALEGEAKQPVEHIMVEEGVTQALVDKTRSKIELDNGDDGFASKDIPRLLHTVWYDFFHEEVWDLIKKHKNPKVDFRDLQRRCFARTKELGNL